MTRILYGVGRDVDTETNLHKVGGSEGKEGWGRGVGPPVVFGRYGVEDRYLLGPMLTRFSFE